VANTSGRSTSTAHGAIASRVRQGVSWKVASQGVSLGLHLSTLILLARLLTPSDFGLAAMVLVFRRLLYLLSDFALTPALIQRPNLTEHDRSTAFWSSLFLGACFTVAGIALAGSVAAFYGEPRVEDLFIVFSLGFVILAFGSTQAALLARELTFRSLEIRNMIGAVGGAAVAIALALGGFGPWALIGQTLGMMAISTLLVWVLSSWRPKLTFSRKSLQHLGGFSGYVFGSQLLTFVIANLDNLLVGKFIGAAPLGAYRLAYNLVIFPLSNLAIPITSVLFPAFSRMAGNPLRLASAWIRATRVVMAVVCPIFIILVVTAPDLIPVVFGEQWSSAIPVVQILSWLGIMHSLRGLNAAVVNACGQPQALLRIAFIGLPVYASGFAAGLHWGITGVAAGAAAAASFVQPLYTAAAAKAVGVQARSVFYASRRVILVSATVLGLVLGLQMVLIAGGVGQAVRLVLVALASVGLYGVMIWKVEPHVAAEVRWLQRQRKNADEHTAA
jgi:O-antigen/teichoic acid export membrane protein